MGRPPMGWAPAVFGRFLKPGYAMALYKADGATVGDLNEAVTTLEEIEPTARRVLGGAHPLTVDIWKTLKIARATWARV